MGMIEHKYDTMYKIIDKIYNLVGYMRAEYDIYNVPMVIYAGRTEFDELRQLVDTKHCQYDCSSDQLICMGMPVYCVYAKSHLSVAVEVSHGDETNIH